MGADDGRAGRGSRCGHCRALCGQLCTQRAGPRHGSTFDLAGRVFKNKPAPTNLEVPPYQYLSDSRLLIAEDNAA